jgi:hypothetical protein
MAIQVGNGPRRRTTLTEAAPNPKTLAILGPAKLPQFLCHQPHFISCGLFHFAPDLL